MKDILTFNSAGSRSEEIYFRITKSVDMPFNGNQILFATDRNQQEVVIKLIPDKEKAEREWAGLLSAYSTKIPISTPLVFGTTKDKTPGIITKKINGRLLYGNKNLDLRRELGSITRRLHSNLQVEQTDRSYSFYEKNSDNFEKSEFALRGLFNKFAWSMSQYCQNTQLIFCHGDLHDGQVINSPNGLVLIDFEKWQSDRPLSELGMYLFHCLRTGVDVQNFKSFIVGYTDRNSLEEMEKQTLMYYLLHISTGALNYFLEEKSWYLEYAKQNHQRVLKFIDDEGIWKIL